jgi:formate hydrogenlyase subunit 3/multisubunit Na+/H+ antiporter MnhD subunit
MPGGWIAVLVLCLLLAASVYVVYEGWTAHSGGAELPDWGLALLGVGAIFGLVIGCGLMALAFYSSRRGYDERAAVGKEDERDADDGR